MAKTQRGRGRPVYWVWMGQSYILTDDGKRTRGDRAYPSSVAFRATDKWLEVHDYYVRCGQVMKLPDFRKEFPGHLTAKGDRVEQAEAA